MAKARDRLSPTPAEVPPVSSTASIRLDAVLVTVTEEHPRILTVQTDRHLDGVPSGPLDADRDKTLELGLRRWIRQQAGIDVGYIEQLYTFGDQDRGIEQTPHQERVVSVAYLGLGAEDSPSMEAKWKDVYTLFPWEDHREHRPPLLDKDLLPRLFAHLDDATWSDRVHIAFAAGSMQWDPVRVLDRYELLYQAGLVAEAFHDQGKTPPATLRTGPALAYDHRRIVATAIGRLRGKLTYRPVIFELLPESFTLLTLQRTVEALHGTRLHKQNFRRVIERGGLVEGTGERTATGGRPAELFRFRQDVLRERPRPGVVFPKP